MVDERNEEESSFQKVGECLYRYLPNNRYYARLKSGGKEIRRSLKTTDRKHAERKLRDLKDSLEMVDARMGKTTVAELVDRYMATLQGREKKTIQKAEHIAKMARLHWPGGMNRRASEVRRSDVETWLAEQSLRPGKKEKTIGKSTQQAYHWFIRAVFELGLQDRVIAENPYNGIRTPRLGKIVRITPSWDDFKNIVANIRGQKHNADAEDSANFIEFMGLAGLGNAEIAGIRRKHILLKQGRIQLRRRKTGAEFEIPIYPQLQPFLENLLRSEPGEPDDYLFKIRDAKKSLDGACKRLGLPHYSHRAIRRCFITRAIELGIDFKTVAAWQGHQDGGVLIARTYSHLRNEHADKMAERMAA